MAPSTTLPGFCPKVAARVNKAPRARTSGRAVFAIAWFTLGSLFLFFLAGLAGAVVFKTFPVSATAVVPAGWALRGPTVSTLPRVMNMARFTCQACFPTYFSKRGRRWKRLCWLHHRRRSRKCVIVEHAYVCPHLGCQKRYAEEAPAVVHVISMSHHHACDAKPTCASTSAGIAAPVATSWTAYLLSYLIILACFHAAVALREMTGARSPRGWCAWFVGV
jgi:hypothetical protein